MTFIMKRMHASGSLGDDLRELREAAGLGLAEASRRTKVLASTIGAWERGDWQSFAPETSYLERMLAAYIRVLGGRESFYLNKFHEEIAALGVKPAAVQPIRTMRPFQGVDLFWTARFRIALSLFVFVFGLGSYVAVQARSLAEPPLVEVAFPQDGQRVTEPIIQVKGKTAPETLVFVNGQPTSLREDGSFEARLEVPSGPTEVQIRVKKRHSRDMIVTRRVVYERS